MLLACDVARGDIYALQVPDVQALHGGTGDPLGYLLLDCRGSQHDTQPLR